VLVNNIRVTTQETVEPTF